MGGGLLEVHVWQPWGHRRLLKLDSIGSSFAPRESPVWSVLPKSVGAPPGPSLGHINEQHGLDGWEFVAGKVGDQLLGATPGGKNLKSDPGLLLGTQGWHTDGEGYGLSVDVKAGGLQVRL